MPNSSPEWWSIADIEGRNEMSLHQYGWSVTTVGGSRYNLPPRRGTDMTIAYRPGQVHRRKVPDARQVTLLMFMVGWEPGTGQAPDDQLVQWNDNWDTLRRSVYTNYLLTEQRVRLIRRWFLTAPTFPTTRVDTDGVYQRDQAIQGDPGVPSAGKRLITAFANAEHTGTMDPSMTGRFRAEFQMDFTLADPYFYGQTVNVALPARTEVVVWNDGYDSVGSGYCQVDLKGPLINPILYNNTTNPISWVRYTGTISSGQTVRLVMNKFTCEQVLPAGNVNKVGNISSKGARYWVNLLPGANRMLLMADTVASTGSATLSFRPPYV